MGKFLFLVAFLPFLSFGAERIYDRCVVTEMKASTQVEAVYGIKRGAVLTFFEGEFGEPALNIDKVQLREENGDRVGPEASLVIDSNWHFRKNESEFYYFLNIGKSGAEPHPGRLFRGRISEGTSGQKTQVAVLSCHY